MRIAPLLASLALASVAAGGATPEGPGTVMFRDTCDGSAAAALPGDLFVGANDETNMLRVYRLTGGRPAAARNISAFLGLDRKEEADIEGAATLRQAGGDVTYWITSHALGKTGEEKPERQRLFATRWDGTTVAPVGRARDDLRRALLAAPALALRGAAAKPPEDGGINIEGLADGGGGALLIGFRSPLVGAGRRALVVSLPDAARLLETGAPIRLGAPVLLDLGGRGIRSLERISGGHYIIIAGPAASRGTFALFVWSGRADQPPRQVPAPLAELMPESAIVRGDGRLMLFSDDGSPLCKGSPRAGKRFRGRAMPLP